MTEVRRRREKISAARKSSVVRRSPKKQAAAVPTMPVEGYVGDMTGPGITDTWGVTATDLGVSAVAPNGKLVSVFGDTFSGAAVGQGDWRAPVALLGSWRHQQPDPIR